ncbi:MAG TPA: RnfABCDGE type electron transport complex subunit D [Candidatus Bathyarchaeia archaeon]|nr:RnfABCDGE type electron transport complex subunit D [Candidatus Bathyarchaeia archaeon]
MYRLLLYYLVTLLAAAMLFGALGWLAFNPFSILFSASYLVLLCYVTNYIFAQLFSAPSNGESAILTGLILSLLITPAASFKEITFLTAAAGLAISSKYILAIRNKHIFNPAAIAVVLTAFGPQESASWWVGTTILLPIVVIGGLLVARKTRRNTMVFTFIGTAIASTAFLFWLDGRDVAVALQNTLLRSSLFFLAFAMLTEPWTSPTTKYRRLIYAAIVGTLFSPALHIGSIYSTPELALVIGNIAAFAMSPIVKTKLHLGKRRMYGAVTEDIEFIPERLFTYKPGQYVEVTLPHPSPDSRGPRRYFTLASSPTEKTLRLGVRYYENGSSFKNTLRHATDNLFMSAGQLGGDFTMPDDKKQKLAFIAGGIGITPFRSMVKYLHDTDDQRSVKLLYGERSMQDIAYEEIFEAARRKVRVDTTYVISQLNSLNSPYIRPGRIDAETIKSHIPDYLERSFYISGPQPMVRAIKEQLTDLGVPSHQIKLDYFFGYA